MKIHPPKPNRDNVDMADQDAIARWVKHLGKSQDEIAAAIEKVGPSCRAIRKELGLDES